MIDLNPDAVCAVIARAREFQSKEEVVLPDVPNNPSEDWGLQALADHIDDLSYQEVKDLIDDLEPDQQRTLLALMWLGRGDYGMDGWQEALADAGDAGITRVADHLLATPLVADYLLEGLRMHDYDCEA